MKQKIIGEYPLGSEYVQIVLREGNGGEFYAMPEHGHIARIKIGADYDTWEEVVSVLIHEVREMIYYRLRCRYEPNNDYSEDHGSYLFVLNHAQFSDACRREAQFLVACLPDISKVWRAWRKWGVKNNGK